jgi:hypothetical protein
MDHEPIFDFTFPHEYAFEVAEELPGTGKVSFATLAPPRLAAKTACCCGSRQSALRHARLLRIRSSLSLLFVERDVGYPNVHYACVIARGTAYGVNTSQPIDLTGFSTSFRF